MATIRSTLQMYDGMSGPIRSVVRATQICINSFEAMQTASSNSIDTSAIQEAREELARAEVQMDGIEENIRQAERQQQRFNESIRGGTSAAGDLWSKIKGVAATVAAGIGINKIIGLSDSLAGSKARLSLIVDDGGSVAELEKKIMRSAQRSRAEYLDTLSVISKLGLMAGKSFSGNDEMIKFAELMNKNFIIAGASAQEQSSATYQLTQAMASGRLQGDEYRSIIENAPLLAKAIEDYMRNVQGAEGSMKEWASEGLLTADVIKNALFSSADEVETRFEKMPKTWGQIWTSMKNKAISIFNPILTKINEIANTEKFNTAVDGIIDALSAIGAVAMWLFDLMVNIVSGIADNWSWLSPIIYGVAAAMLAYQIATKGAIVADAIHKGIMMAAVPIYSLLTGATMAETAAQWGLNAAMYACPIVWIIILIIALIALFYAAVAAVNHFAGTSVSATGIICGAFMVALAFIGNIFVALWNLVVDVFVLIYNLVAEVANFIGNVFTDPIGAICRLFFGLADTVLGILQALASAIDAIFGSNLAGSVQGWRDSLSGWVDDTFGKGEEIMAKMNADDLKLGRFEYGAAYDLGYNFGQGIDDKVSGMFDFNNMDSLDAYGLGDSLDGIYGNTGDTAGNTAEMRDSLDITEEDLKYLRDIAEREAINRFTTAEINIEQHNENHIASDVDLDGVLDKFTNDFAERLDVSAEGVHE